VDYALSGLDYETLAAAGTTITTNKCSGNKCSGRTAQDKYTERLVFMTGTTVSFARPKWGKSVSKLVSKPVPPKPTMSTGSCNSSNSTGSSDNHTLLASTVAGKAFDQYSPYSPFSHGQVSRFVGLYQFIKLVLYYT
jgi:hypothetical protein